LKQSVIKEKTGDHTQHVRQNDLFDSVIGFVLVMLCALALSQGLTQAGSAAMLSEGIVAHSPFNFSTTKCQTNLVASERSSLGSEFGTQYPATDVNGPVHLTSASVSGPNWFYKLSGKCDAHVISALRGLILLDNGPVLRLADSSLDSLDV
jgi:hypothetical protein